MRAETKARSGYERAKDLTLPSSKPPEHMHIQSEKDVCLLTGGSDRPYVFGLTTALIPMGATIDLIGSDELEFPEFNSLDGLRFHNLRGSSRRDVSPWVKVSRIAKYYFRLICFAITARPKIFHILWNNKFEYFDRTLLMLFYRLLGKKVVITVHNVNTRKRDLTDGFMNRWTLKIQYGLAHHLFVHTEKMREELIEEFKVRAECVSVIPFGINNAVPRTPLTPSAAKERLKLNPEHKAILFFGRITPYKGLDRLLPVFRKLALIDNDYRLIIAGRPDNCDEYWAGVRTDLEEDVRSGTILLNDDFIPDEQVEVYFKAADALILPYRDIYQSGVLFLGQSFGLPVLASDVGSLKNEIVEGENGYVFDLKSPAGMEEIIGRYFLSELYKELDNQREKIRRIAMDLHSWDEVARATLKVYSDLTNVASGDVAGDNKTRGAASADAKVN
jgi:D-inositol-3-phosphate glycosyltransferase